MPTGMRELDLERAVQVGDVVQALRKYLNDADIARASHASTRSVRNWLRKSNAARAHEEQLWQLRDIVVVLRESLTPRGVGQWLRAPNRMLSGRRPIELLAEGKVDQVREAAASYVEGTYV